MKKTNLKRKRILPAKSPLKKKRDIGLEGSKTPLGASKGIRKVSEATKERKKAKKANFTAFARDWGMPAYVLKTGKTALRYSGNIEKGVAWFWFARFVRARDAKKYGTCIACGKPFPYEKLQAGHFRAASNCGHGLLMDETNVNGECEQCNAWDDMHLFGYAQGLDDRHGEGTSFRLRNEPRAEGREPSRAEYLEKARIYRAKWHELMEIPLSTPPEETEQKDTTPEV